MSNTLLPETTETISLSTERVRRYREKHRRIDYVPDEAVLKIINGYVAINPIQPLAAILDHLIREGHKAISGNTQS